MFRSKFGMSPKTYRQLYSKIIKQNPCYNSFPGLIVSFLKAIICFHFL